MEVALQQAETLIVVDDEARLAHALRLARGFALFFVRCNVPLYRAEVVARLKKTLSRPIVEVGLTDEPEVYPAIARAAESAPGEGVLFIYGLEAHLPSADRARAMQTLRELNWRRAAYQRLARPLVFWLPEYALALLAREAPDFYDWNSGVFELTVPEPVREVFLLEALAVPEAEAFLSLPLDQKEARIRLLEGLWEEYRGALPAEQRARLRLALQLGDLHFSLGRYEEARRWLTEARRLARALEDRQGEARTLTNLGNIYWMQGRWEEAIGLYEQALETFRTLGDRHREAQMLANLGNVYFQQGRWEEALEQYQQALETFRILSDWHGEAQTLGNLGNVYSDQGRWEEAIGLYRRALETFRALGDRHGEAQALYRLGMLAQKRGDLEEATRLYRESLAIQESLGDLWGKAMTLEAMGRVLLAQRRIQEGVQALQQALEILDRMGAQANAERVAGILESVRQELGEEAFRGAG